ncbi:MAG: hypothetical protein KME43_07505 [Myxacorys chilensis ATA2-1-KO14]|jgi:hypothetical protein|nr:hypothetical protein [Myxacorys chilensis ATA2-1-KO14]
MSNQLAPLEQLNASDQEKHSEMSNCNVISIEKLDSYQRLQLRHDKIYHPEILLLRVAERMNHIALHLTKYLGALYSLPNSAVENRKAFIDSFIMVVSASNLLGILLSESLESDEVTDTAETFIKGYIQILSEIAKACEATDHQEDYPSRRILNRNIRSLFTLLLCEAASRNISILDEASHRLVSVERKHPLYKILREEE